MSLHDKPNANEADGNWEDTDGCYQQQLRCWNMNVVGANRETAGGEKWGKPAEIVIACCYHRYDTENKRKGTEDHKVVTAFELA